MVKNYAKWFLLISATFLFFFSVIAQDQDSWKDFSDNQTIKSMDGLYFSVPEDRPIIRRGGVLMLMPLDEYVALKFSKLEDNLKKIETAINQIEQKIALIEGKVDFLNKEKVFLEKFP